MNKRIKELAEQATTYIEPVPGHSGEGWIFDKEKFAELIIRECAQFIIVLDAEPVSHKSAARMLQEHFGVKE
jgi:hypothetical protein